MAKPREGDTDTNQILVMLEQLGAFMVKDEFFIIIDTWRGKPNIGKKESFFARTLRRAQAGPCLLSLPNVQVQGKVLT